MRALTITILTFLTIFGCLDQTSKDIKQVKATELDIDTNINSRQTIIADDSARFYMSVKRLEEINFFIAGLDSVVVTKDPTEIIELNTTKSAFYNSSENSDTGHSKYLTVDLVRKYHVKRIDGQLGARPSANIIQLSFKDSEEANNWFDVFDKSYKKKIIQSKPKTELWLDSNHVYFVQTYHTPLMDYVDLIKKNIIENLKK